MADAAFYSSVSKMSPSKSAASTSSSSSSPSPTKLKSKEKESDLHSSLDIKGEKGTGFEHRIVAGIDKGKFECGNCAYFVGPMGEKSGKRGEKGCNQNLMRERSKEPKLPDGRVQVDADDCCEFIERLGVKAEETGDKNSETPEKSVSK